MVYRYATPHFEPNFNAAMRPSAFCDTVRLADMRAVTTMRGFTLLELLIVLVIVGITLGMISFKGLPDDRQILLSDAQRIALLLQLARDEAIVRNRPLAFEAEAGGYRFLIRDEGTWQVIEQDDLLRERKFKKSPVILFMSPSTADPTAPIRIIFGREPVDKPFTLTMSLGEQQVAIHADGIGHYSVE